MPMEPLSLPGMEKEKSGTEQSIPTGVSSTVSSEIEAEPGYHLKMGHPERRFGRTVTWRIIAERTTNLPQKYLSPLLQVI